MLRQVKPLVICLVRWVLLPFFFVEKRGRAAFGGPMGGARKVLWRAGAGFTASRLARAGVPG